MMEEKKEIYEVSWNNKVVYCCSKHTSEIVSLGLMLSKYVPAKLCKDDTKFCAKCFIEERIASGCN